MSTNLRWNHFVIFSATLVVVYLIFLPYHQAYPPASIKKLIAPWAEGAEDYYSGYHEVPTSVMLEDRPSNDRIQPNRRKANAAFVVLVRNSELRAMVNSMKQMEDRFNHWAGYDYVFLNDEEFTEDFIRFTSSLTDAKCHYGTVGDSLWEPPSWIDQGRATAAREQMESDGVPYGGSLSYRNMCRFNSGLFYRHPLVEKYDYYWRIEPGVSFFCDISYDPFLLMQDEKKVYGFTMSLLEVPATIPTLWNETKNFIAAHPELVPEDNAAGFLSDDGGETYNNCHFWSNFEIGDLNFWRSKPYSTYFDWLDRRGGFYYERWGDAPVHSIGAALLARRDQLHWFDDIGYRHEPFQHCPQGAAHALNKCWCDINDNFDDSEWSCMSRWHRLDN